MKVKIVSLFLIFLSLLLHGCIGINDDFIEIRNAVLENLDENYRSEYQFSVGSVAITISGWFVDAAAEDDLAPEILDNVSSVQVGIYKKIRNTSYPDIATLRELEDEMRQKGWKSIVLTCDRDELNGIYIRSNPVETLDRLFVISLDDDELILVEIEGDLKELIATVIRDKGMSLEI